ncbi:GL22629 [Drosophila persimilis]|uniref:SHC-transforming protein 2 n=2 Tax=pseudoobscura subgroup TaxID=32358 RepID=Q29FA1_DROPS|nr:SHC-transforming protein 2 [Drosophila pseudoobscura]XP_002024744.1 SHC-transforming protein 2 [Drosophila persimilis]EDW30192.1 GL22629 [Drosophila persimilis]
MPRNGDAGNGAPRSGTGGTSDGCIYPDDVIMGVGVAFNVRYTGCVEVKTSMKSLDFETRTQLARECINRVCEAAGLKSAGKRRLCSFISDRPSMQHAGTNIIINVSSRALTLSNVESGEVIVNHNMPRISFASGGDNDTLDFLAYIAKNEDEWRACYVLECAGGQSEDLIVTIGKAFALRFNALSRHKDPTADNINQSCKENVKEYYNDLPDKLPPELPNDDKRSQPQQQHQTAQLPLHSHAPRVAQLNLKKPRDRLSSNLIDLNSPPPDQTTNKLALGHSSASTTSSSTLTAGQVRDVFDGPQCPLTAEVWFHAAISRPISERLLQQDGDFLVRESQGKRGQYVLTGLEGKTPKHLLLIDPEGVVRTKDRIFDSISHLINYHWAHALPIISEDSELVLRNPVRRPAQDQAAVAVAGATIAAP